MADEEVVTLPEGAKDAAYWEAEAKRSFKERDSAKRAAKAASDELESRRAADDAAQAKAEDERRRKAGEFDDWRKQITAEHDVKLKAREARLAHAVKLSEFGAATDYFGGGDSAKTVLDATLGMDVLGKYVSVETTEDEIGYRVSVKRPDGKVILGADGAPAPFQAAIGELIAALPNKDRILRGSGKTGSGSAGGKTGTAAVLDLQALTDKARSGDKEALAVLKSRQANSGSLVFGSAFTR